MFRQIAAAIAACLAIFSATPAFADIKAYNAAVQRGDYAAAAAEVGPIWAAYDKTSDDAIVVAREFAWMSMLAGKPEQANGIAHWLAEQGPQAAHPDPHPQTSMVLLRWTELGDKPSAKAIKALSDAVADRMAVADPGDRISAVAAKDLYMAEWKLGRWTDVERDAAAASKLYAALDGEGVQFAIGGEIDAIAAEFMDREEIGPYFKMADVRAELIRKIGHDPQGGEDDGVDTPMELLNHRAAIWMGAMMAYYWSSQSNFAHPGMIAQYKRAMALKIPGACPEDGCVDDLPPGVKRLCKVKWVQNPPMTYPRQARAKRMVGAIRLRVKTDENGNVLDARLVAAVPSAEFPEPSLAVVKKWTVTRRDGQPADCRLAGSRLLDLEFMMGW